jgi:hypothetical protein
MKWIYLQVTMQDVIGMKMIYRKEELCQPLAKPLQ